MYCSEYFTTIPAVLRPVDVRTYIIVSASVRVFFSAWELRYFTSSSSRKMSKLSIIQGITCLSWVCDSWRVFGWDPVLYCVVAKYARMYTIDNTYIRTYYLLYVHTHAHTHTHTHTHTHMHAHTHARTHTHAHTHTRARTHTHTLVHAHTHTHTHTITLYSTYLLVLWLYSDCGKYPSCRLVQHQTLNTCLCSYLSVLKCNTRSHYRCTCCTYSVRPQLK